MSILDKPHDQRGSTRSGEDLGYHVEARCAGGRDNPFSIGGVGVRSSWTRIPLSSGGDLPISRETKAPQLMMTDLIDYPCAEAVRWHFVAMCNAAYKDVETRIVEHRIKWSVESEPTEAFAEVVADMLIWPKKKP